MPCSKPYIRFNWFINWTQQTCIVLFQALIIKRIILNNLNNMDGEGEESSSVASNINVNDSDEEEATEAVTTTGTVAVVADSLPRPRVVKFAYRDFTHVGDKWSATCQKCDRRLTDKAGVTTTFVKYAIIIITLLS